jgi:hypothetical protein
MPPLRGKQKIKYHIDQPFRTQVVLKGISITNIHKKNLLYEHLTLENYAESD